tara:strand:- start:138 stop:491 length:354 start_codon:yes stop_codon:yes gene_type:complete
MIAIYAALINAIFVPAGFNKIKQFGDTALGLEKRTFGKMLPMVFYKFTIFLVILLEILGPILIILGSLSKDYKIYAKYLCYLLAVFTIVATLLYHPNNYLPNLSLTGGLLLLAANFD